MVERLLPRLEALERADPGNPAPALTRGRALRSLNRGREAAEAIQALEAQVQTLADDLRAVEAQAPKVVEQAERLEARAGSLRFVDKRLTQFEEKLAHMDTVEQELAQSLKSLNVVHDKAEEAKRVLTDIDRSQSQIEDAEKRLAQADTLLTDIRAGLDTLRQEREITRVVVDNVIETTGKLSYQAKEAEGLLAKLRQEREITERIQEVAKEMRVDEAQAS